MDQLDAILHESQRLGFLGPGPVARHRNHAQAFVAALASPPFRILDLGSGGGVPGLIMAGMAGWAATQWVLLDASHRRTRFLSWAVDTLGWQGRMEVRQGRAEELGRRDDLRRSFDAVVARSFAAPAVVAECGAPFLAVDGQLVVSEPPDAGGCQGLRWPPEPLARMGLRPVERVTIGEGGEATVMVLRQDHLCPAEYPRRTGRPARHPLY